MSEIRVDNNSIIIVNRDITSLDVECIVNAANRTLLGGGGVDGAIHRAAGPGLLEECKTLNGCNVGEAKITRGYNLKAKFVIHTVGPIYSASPEDPKKLSCCYRNALELAKENAIHSIAFPSISAGVYGYPMKDAASVAFKTVTQWLRDNPQYGINVTMCCFHDSTVKIYEDICKKLID